MLIAGGVNVYGTKALPYWQTTIFALHVAAYFGYIIPIWANAPRATHYQVWGEFQNSGGWSSIGLAILVGQLSGISQNTGIDTVCVHNKRLMSSRDCRLICVLTCRS